MKSGTRPLFGLIGLGALLVYILACASFSPDDSKVVYPSFHEPSGQTGVSLYDRKTRRSEQIYVAPLIASTNKPPGSADPSLLRPQWLPDGRRVLVAAADGKEMMLTLVPYGAREAIRFFLINDLQDSQGRLLLPLPVIGSKVFLSLDDKLIGRLDLSTGEMQKFELEGDTQLYASPDGRGLFYLQERGGDSPGLTFGRMNPDTVVMTSMIESTNSFENGSFFAFTRDGRKLALLTFIEKEARLVLLGPGNAMSSRPLKIEAEEVAFSHVALFSAAGDKIYAGYRLQRKKGGESEFGVVEIPVTEAAPRWTKLFTVAKAQKEEEMYFQPALSHDGRTLAVSSTYFAMDNKTLKPEDCALFLVDLSHPKRKVTKVKVPLPRGQSH